MPSTYLFTSVPTAPTTRLLALGWVQAESTCHGVCCVLCSVPVTQGVIPPNAVLSIYLLLHNLH